jgi:hypothetical protein
MRLFSFQGAFLLQQMPASICTMLIESQKMTHKEAKDEGTSHTGFWPDSCLIPAREMQRRIQGRELGTRSRDQKCPSSSPLISSPHKIVLLPQLVGYFQYVHLTLTIFWFRHSSVTDLIQYKNSHLVLAFIKLVIDLAIRSILFQAGRGGAHL